MLAFFDSLIPSHFGAVHFQCSTLLICHTSSLNFENAKVKIDLKPLVKCNRSRNKKSDKTYINNINSELDKLHIALPALPTLDMDQ